jgi:hypothetical protein
LTKLEPGFTTVEFTAGIESISQEIESQRMLSFIQGISMVNPTLLPQRLNLDEYATRLANYLQIPLNKLWLSQEESAESAGVDSLVGLSKQLGPQGIQQLYTLGVGLLQQMVGMSQEQVAGQQPQEQSDVNSVENPNAL